jgi:FMN phosphatase YigB (HAD superfamily)
MKSLDKKKIVLFDIDYTLFDTKAFKDSRLSNYVLYPETIPVLESIFGKIDLGIFSTGEKEFQQEKLRRTDLQKFFKPGNSHIFKNKHSGIAQVLKQYGEWQIYLVDDKLDVLKKAKAEASFVTTIWVERGPYALEHSLLAKFTPDARIPDLRQLPEIILGN